MKTYTVLLPEDVPHYGSIEITAETDVQAIEAAKALTLDDAASIDAEWCNAVCRRIVHIEDDDGKIVGDDIPLDDCFLRYGGDEDRRLCDAAPQLLAALQAVFAWWTTTPAFHDGEDEMPAEIFDGIRYAIAKAEGRP